MEKTNKLKKYKNQLKKYKNQLKKSLKKKLKRRQKRYKKQKILYKNPKERSSLLLLILLNLPKVKVKNIKLIEKTSKKILYWIKNKLKKLPKLSWHIMKKIKNKMIYLILVMISFI